MYYEDLKSLPPNTLTPAPFWADFEPMLFPMKFLASKAELGFQYDTTLATSI